MKKFSLLLMILVSMLTNSALAFPTDTLGCTIRHGDENVQNIYFKIEHSDVPSGKGELYLSDWYTPSNLGGTIHYSDCGIIDAPCTSKVEASWKTFLKREVKAKIGWTSIYYERGGWAPAINMLSIDLGSLGKLEVNVTKWTYAGSGIGVISSSIENFKYTAAVVHCSYFQVVGVRPGMTGSN